MATRGRKSATAQKLTVVGGSTKRVPAPDDLTEDQAAIWVAITASLPADYFRPGDEPLLAAYCRAYDFHRQASKLIERGGITLMDEKGREYANPAQQMLNTQGSAMAQLAGKLRLCPSARYSTKSASTATDNASVSKKPWAA